MKAEVKLACGRLYVGLGGIVIAMETDPCREPRIHSNSYDEAALKQLADLINERIAPEVKP